LDRIRWFQQQVARLRRSESKPVTGELRASAAGFLAEIDRTQREVREFLSAHPSELAGVA
jgi:hypothetical protein